MQNCNDFIIGNTLQPTKQEIDVVGKLPIVVKKNVLGSVIRYTVSTEIEVPEKGDPGEDGKSATIKIGTVQLGETTQVHNSGDDQNVILDFTLQKGDKGDPGSSVKGDQGESASIKLGIVKSGELAEVKNTGTDQNVVLDITLPKGDKGKDGITLGIKEYKISVGNTNGNSYYPMNQFGVGSFVDSGDNELKRYKIRGWVTVANMQNWCTLRLTSGNSQSYNGSTLISQRVKHSEATTYVGQYEINAYFETTDRYIGFSFSDTNSSAFSSDGAQYGDFGIEVFILN
jgi:hypothetical protein